MSALTPVSGVVSVAASSTATIQPAAGENWVITALWLQSALLTASMYDATTAVAMDSGLATDRWADAEWYINNSVYIQIANGDAGNAWTVHYSGFKLPAGMTVVSTVQTIAASGTYDYQPDAGKVRLIRMWKSASDSLNLRLVDGAVTAGILLPDGNRGGGTTDNFLIKLFTDNGCFARVTNESGATAYTCAFSAVDIATSTIVVQSAAFEVAGTTTYNFRPGAGEAWLLTERGADSYTSLTFQLYDGADTAIISYTDANSAYPSRFLLTNDCYLQVVNGGAVTRTVCVSAVSVP